MKESRKSSIKKKFLSDLGIDNMKPMDYISSALDQTDLVVVGSIDLLKKQEGRGLFATKNIPAGTCIGIYTGVVFDSQKEFELYFEENSDANNAYTMDVGTKVVDAADQGNFTRYINFSDSQFNTIFVEGTHNRSKVAKVITTKDIFEGEQFLIDYNQYCEDFSQKYFFLNPEDGQNSAKEVQEIYSEHYTLMKMNIDIEAVQLKKNDHLYATSIGNVILQNGSLSQLDEMPDLATADLPFLKTNKVKVILDFDEVDNFTPLMLACYAGQLENVAWLLQHKVNVNRQQHHSGKCPLFLALEGYANAAIDDKAIFVKIITLLINNKANILVHDRADMTFLHKAISVLSTKDFKTILTLIQKQEHIVFSDLFTYIDENDLDILLHCFKNKSFDKAKILLDLFPSYFIESSKNKEQKLFCKEEYKNAIKDYDEEDREVLLKLLSNKNYKVPSELLEELAPGVEEYYSDNNSYSY